VEDGGSAAESNFKRVWVEPHSGGDLDVTYPYGWAVVNSEWILRFSPDLPTRIDDRKVFMYWRKTTWERFRRADITRSYLLREGKVASYNYFELPHDREGFRFHLFWCIEIPSKPRAADIGFGKPLYRNDCPHHPFKPSSFFRRKRPGGDKAPGNEKLPPNVARSQALSLTPGG
jgi:hypothetical protein